MSGGMEEACEGGVGCHHDPMCRGSYEVGMARPQTGGTHYQLPIQPVDYIVENGLGYLEGNVVKYVTRHRAKNGVEDIEKAIDYCNMIKEKVYGIPRA